MICGVGVLTRVRQWTREHGEQALRGVCGWVNGTGRGALLVLVESRRAAGPQRPKITYLLTSRRFSDFGFQISDAGRKVSSVYALRACTLARELERPAHASSTQQPARRETR